MTDYAAFWDEKPLWVEVLLRRISIEGLRGVARSLDVSHTLISLCLRKQKPAGGLAVRVLAKWGQITCTAYDDEISFVECEARRKQPCPTHNPMAMQRWKTCLHCPHNPEQQGACDAKTGGETHCHSQARQALLVGVPGAKRVGVRR